MKTKIAAILTFAGLTAFLPTSARADSVSYNFSGCTDAHKCSGNTGSTTANYTSDGYTITATAFSKNNYDLYIKTDGGDEHGLGMTGTSDDEIEPHEFIQLNVTNLFNAGATSGTLELGSVQSGEGYQICVSNVDGSDTGHCFKGNLDEKPITVNFGGGYDYIDITATKGDVLISSLCVQTPTPTPEPSSLMLFGSGVLSLVGLVRKRVIA
jgi:hypothetical protein